MIEVKNLTKIYGTFMAIKDVSFQAKKGHILGFLGPNGAGKTTTMRIISGYMPASSGTVLVDGLDIFTQSLEARRRIGYLPENPPLYAEMRVEAYLRFAGRLRGISRADLEGAVNHVLDVCGLKEVSSRICGQLSKGYRQRVGLAGAIIHDPQVLILDEPTIGLDPRGLGADRTIVLSTHILPEVAQICDRVVIINEGHVVLEESLDQLPAGTSLEDVFLDAIARERGHEDMEAEQELEEVGAGRSSAQ
jgi:ABC-2 type transport system ATP-binding protein